MNAIGRQSIPCLVHILPARKYINLNSPSTRLPCVLIFDMALDSYWNHKDQCFIFITPTGVPEPPRLCELRNDSNLEVVCQAGNDGGLQQHFVLEAVGATSMYFNNLDSTRSTHEILDNEISTMNDQVRFDRPFFPFRLFVLLTLRTSIPQVWWIDAEEGGGEWRAWLIGNWQKLSA